MQSVGLPTGFGKYCLLAKLATGGMGELFLARLEADHGFEKLVVIKRILPHLTDKKEFVDMFVNEARIAARLSHPNICQIYELGEISGRYYMALEYLEGVPLVDVLLSRKRAHKLGDMRLVTALMMQACEGIYAAHNLRNSDGEPANIVHRDINPRNIFITTAGVAKILDFGVAKVRGALAQTRTGSVKGTYSYMSPEQLHGEPLDGRSDVFALGVCTWESVVGRRLFKRESDFATWKAITEQEIPRPSQVRADVPPALDDAIYRALAQRREERFQSAREFALALDKATAELGAPLSSLAIAAELERVFEADLEKQRNRLFDAKRASEEAEPRILSDSELEMDGPTLLHVPAPAPVSPEGVVLDAVDAQPTIPQPASELNESLFDPAPPVTGPQQPLGKYPDHSVHTPITGSGSHIGPSAVAAQVGTLSDVDVRPNRRGWVIAGVAAIAIGLGLGFYLPMESETGASATTSTTSTTSTTVATAQPSPATKPETETETKTKTKSDHAESAADQPAPAKTEPRPGSVQAAVQAAGPSDAPAPAAAPEHDSKDDEHEARDKADKRRERREARKREKEERKQRDEADDDAPAPTGNGSFTVTATPYATVYIDGKKRGVTPLARVRLKAGKHSVRLVSSNKAHEPKRFTITVVPDETVRRKVSW